MWSRATGQTEWLVASTLAPDRNAGNIVVPMC